MAEKILHKAASAVKGNRRNGRDGRPPAFLFYAADWLADCEVRRMTGAQRGLYIDLLAVCWREGSVPDDPEGLGRALGYTGEEMRDAWPGVLARFRRQAGGRLVNPRLERERAAMAAMRVSLSEAGKTGARKRWQERHLNSQAIAPPIAPPMRFDGIASAFAEAEKRESSGDRNLFGDLETSPPVEALPVAPATGSSVTAKQKAKRRRIAYTQAFEFCWAHYGKYPDKPEAFEEWRRLDPPPVPAEVIAGINWWEQSRQWRDGAKPYFRKFLKRRQWEARPAGVAVGDWKESFIAAGEKQGDKVQRETQRSAVAETKNRNPAGG